MQNAVIQPRLAGAVGSGECFYRVRLYNAIQGEDGDIICIEHLALSHALADGLKKLEAALRKCGASLKDGHNVIFVDRVFSDGNTKPVPRDDWHQIVHELTGGKITM